MLSETIDFLFPKFCLGCKVILSKYQNQLCENCKCDLPFTHWAFNSDNYIYHKLQPYVAIKQATSLLRFHKENKTQELLHQLKYGRQQELGILFADMLYSTLAKEVHSKPNCIVPIPIHPKKMKIRGYNQLDYFGEKLAKELGISYVDNALERKIHQKSQTFKNRQERLDSIQNSYQIGKNSIKDHVLLIDDVCTTGATLINCASILLKIPQVEVSIATIATVY